MGLHPRGREGSLRPTGSGVVAPRRYGRVAEVVRTARSWRAWRCARLLEGSRVEVGQPGESHVTQLISPAISETEHQTASGRRGSAGGVSSQKS